MAWILAPALTALRTQINAAYPRRDKTTDGSIGDAAHNARKSDHNADWDSTPPGMVRAIDVDKDALGLGREADSLAETQRIVDALTTDERTAYVIYRERIWQNPAVFPKAPGWRPYTAAGKTGWFNPHKEHFHVSLRRGPRFEQDTSPWPLTTTTSEEDTMTPAQETRLHTRLDQLAEYTKAWGVALSQEATANRDLLAGFTRNTVQAAVSAAVSTTPGINQVDLDAAVSRAIANVALPVSGVVTIDLPKG